MEANKLDFVPRLSFLPFEWRTLGVAFGGGSAAGSGYEASASGRCSFTVRSGTDPLEQVSTGRVSEGVADAGVALQHKSLALSLTAGNLSFRSGLDDPAASVSRLVGEAAVPSLKVTAAKRLGTDASFAAVSYDLKQRKPELSVCWAGDTPSERATLLLKVDPVMRALRVSAAVSTPGPEWRKVLFDDETNQIEYPQDDGGRHTLYVQHVARGTDLLHRTRVGCRLDVGRLVNFAVDYFDYHIEENLPSFIWRIPFMGHLYNLVVPVEDDDQVRYRMKGWELDVSHEFGPGRRPCLELAKTFGRGGKAGAGGTTLSAKYDLGSRAVGLGLGRPGVALEARLARGADGQGWKRPSLHLAVEPLTLLSL